MATILCLLLLTAPGAEPAPDPVGEIEEEVNFDEEEEEVDFGDESGSALIRRVELPGVEYRPWLLGFPLVLVALLGWNVGWRRPSTKTRPPRSGSPG